MSELGTKINSINTILAFNTLTNENEEVIIEPCYKGSDYITFKQNGLELIIRKECLEKASKNAVNIPYHGNPFKPNSMHYYDVQTYFKTTNIVEVYDLNEGEIETISIENFEESRNGGIVLLKIDKLALLISQDSLESACDNATNTYCN